MVEWKTVRYLQTSDAGPVEQHTYRYTLELPRPLADWDVFAYWERARTESIASTLRRGDVLFDVGTEHAWLSVAYAQTVGPGAMVLIEPSTVLWPNIRETWLRNFTAPPLAVAHCLLGPDGDDLDPAHFAADGEGGWPDAIDGPMSGATAYTYLHENPTGVPTTTLDRLARQVGRPPAGITIDVEGAELLVLRGAVETLQEHRPHVWVSIHPDLMWRDYGTADDSLHGFMDDLGYRGTHLATDHEQHWHFQPWERQ